MMAEPQPCRTRGHYPCKAYLWDRPGCLDCCKGPRGTEEKVAAT